VTSEKEISLGSPGVLDGFVLWAHVAAAFWARFCLVLDFVTICTEAKGMIMLKNPE